MLESTGSMDHLCEQLTGYEQFFRLHRSFLVNLEHIKRIAPKAITMTDDTELPLPRGKYTEVKDLYLEYAFRQKAGVFNVTPLYICNTVAVGLFGIVLSAAFCNITWSRRKVLEMALFTLGIFLLQAVVYFGITPELGQYLYPLHTHLPLILILCLLSRAAALARYLRADRVSLLSAPPLAGAAHRGALRRRRRHAAGRGAGADRAAASAFARAAPPCAPSPNILHRFNASSASSRLCTMPSTI